MNIATEFYLLSRIRRQMLKNDVTHLTKEKVIRFTLLALLGVVFFALDYLFFRRIISYIAKIDVLDMIEVGTILVARLLNMILLTFFAMLVFSNVVVALSTFYLSSDLGFLLSSPVRFSAIFTTKFIETALNSSGILLIFGLPIFIVCGQEYQANWLYYVAIPLLLFPFIVIPATVGTMLTMLLVRFFPVRRVQQALTVFALVMGSGLVMLFRFLRPEQLVNEIGMTQLLSYIQTNRIPAAPYLPSTWIAEALMSLLEKKLPVAALNAGWLCGAALGAYLLAVGMAKWIYYAGWTGTAESRTVKTMQRGVVTERLVKHMTFLHPTTRSLLMKDIKLFWRDTTQWSQLLMLAALLVIYFFNIKSLPLDSLPFNTTSLKNGISFLNIGLAGFVLASIGARFVFPSTSLEGGSFWVVHSSPILYRRFILEKFMIFLLPLLILAELLVVISNILLDVDSYLMLLSTVTIFLMSIGLTGLGVGMGAIYPKFINENPAQIAMSIGGILYMILSFIYIGLTIVLEAWPVYIYFSQRVFSQSIKGAETGLVISYTLVVALSVLITILPLYLGIRRLKSFEIL